MGNRLNGVNGDGLELARCEINLEDESKRFVWRLKGGEGGMLTCYSPKPWGIVVHWNNTTRRTQPHFTDAGKCQGCIDELPRKELYYLFAKHHEGKRYVFLELTDGATKALHRDLAPGESLRGCGLFVQRSKADNGRLTIRLVRQELIVSTLPPDEDPQATLLALWKIKRGDPRGGREFPTSRNGFHPHKSRE